MQKNKDKLGKMIFCKSFMFKINFIIFYYIQMSQVQIESCTRCNNAFEQNQKIEESQFIPFLICPDGHFLCTTCYKSYMKTEPRRCPYDGKELRVDIPIKALKLSEVSLFNKNATAYLDLDKQNQDIKRNIERVKRDIQQLPNHPNIPRLRQRPSLPPINNRSRLAQELERLKKELTEWKDSSDFRHLVLWLILEIPLGLIQLASTIFQIYILSWSVNTDYQQLATIIFYFIILYLTTALIYYKQIFDLQAFANITLKGMLCQLLKLPFILLMYFRLVFDISIKTVDNYVNRNSQIFKLKDTLAFQKVNFLFLLGKSVIFLQQFIRLFDLTYSRVNQAVFVFSIMEIIAYIACDALNYKMLAKPQSKE